MTVFFGGKHNRCLGENETFVLPLDAIRLFIYVCNRFKLVKCVKFSGLYMTMIIRNFRKVFITEFGVFFVRPHIHWSVLIALLCEQCLVEVPSFVSSFCIWLLLVFSRLLKNRLKLIVSDIILSLISFSLPLCIRKLNPVEYSFVVLDIIMVFIYAHVRNQINKGVH